MAYWLFKSEPGAWSWRDQAEAGAAGAFWDGVRNPQAHANMKAMQVGDRGFFYHSGADKAVVGLVEVVAPWAPDPADATGKWGAVRLKALAPLSKPVSLAAIKAEKRLAAMVLATNPRLSVQPVTPEEWRLVCEMGGASA